MTTVNRKSREYSDLDLLFESHPYTKDVNRNFDFEAIKASVRNLVLTKNYERPFQPELGCQIYSLLFENFSPAVKAAAERTVTNVIERFEPRVRLISVNVFESVDENGLSVEIIFTPKNIDLPITVLTTLSRAR
jgi:phage baseplate assembly protein W